MLVASGGIDIHAVPRRPRFQRTLTASRIRPARKPTATLTATQSNAVPRMIASAPPRADFTRLLHARSTPASASKAPTAASGTSLDREDSREVPPNEGGDKKVGGVMNRINPQDFISDIHKFTTHLKSMLFCNERERLIDFYSRMLTLVEKGARMELVRQEADEFFKGIDDIDYAGG